MLQPRTRTDRRRGAAGDYISTGYNVIPSGFQKLSPGRFRQSPITPGVIVTTNGWKSPAEISFNLVDIVNKDGNYLLNARPMARGVVPETAQENLHAIGHWQKSAARQHAALGHFTSTMNSADRVQAVPRTHAAGHTYHACRYVERLRADACSAEHTFVR
jgi:alpha-L-fucosidase